jgi:WD40 repeat protein
LQKEEAIKQTFSFVTHNLDLQISSHQIFSTKFSPESSLLAATTEDGLIKVLCANTGQSYYSVQADPEAAAKGETILPVTNIAWRPNQSIHQYD